MRAALVTLHNVRNYGSVLQTLATQRLIERAGAQCSVVDFRREGIGDDAASYFAGSRYARVPLAPQVYSAFRERDARRRSLVFRDFIKRRVRVTSGHYGSFDDLKRVHERRTGRRDGECFGILNSIGVLYDMSGCADGVVR